MLIRCRYKETTPSFRHLKMTGRGSFNHGRALLLALPVVSSASWTGTLKLEGDPGKVNEVTGYTHHLGVSLSIYCVCLFLL